jgi:DNA-binding CsgD family transcriptional regulator
MSRLTERERQILERMAKAHSSKAAARELGISPRTVEKHRHRVMKKLGAKSAADVVRIVAALATPPG